MLDHIAIQVDDIAASAAFYEAVLAPLGGERKKQFGQDISFGVDGHPLWLVPAADSAPAREVHIAFAAADRDTVDAFFAAARAVGAGVLHAPRLRSPAGSAAMGVSARPPARRRGVRPRTKRMSETRNRG